MKLKNVYVYFLQVLLIVTVFCSTSYADIFNMPVGIFYPSAYVNPKSRVTGAIFYENINDTTDVFNVKDSEFLSSAPGTVGDLDGTGISLKYGFLNKTEIGAAFSHKNIDYSIDTLKINTIDLFLKRQINNDTDRLPVFAIKLGIKFNKTEDVFIDNMSAINFLLNKMSETDIEIRIGDEYLWVEKKTGADEISIGISREGKPDPKISIESSKDFTSYFRIIAGKSYKKVLATFFAEFGISAIDTVIDSTFPLYIPDQYQDRLPDFPKDLSRDEKYFKTGAGIICMFTDKFYMGLNYNYLKILRDDNLSCIDDNHIVNADMWYLINKHVGLNLGGTFFQSQLNGVVPSLYNKYTKTTFDHNYGTVHFAVTFLFGGDLN